MSELVMDTQPTARPPVSAVERSAVGERRRVHVGRLLAAERIKLLSTRSVYWCAGLTVALVVGVMSLIAALTPHLGRVSESVPFVARLGYPLVLVIATLAVTGDHRYGTLRTTFLAAPRRPSVLVAKTAVVAVTSGVVGLAAAFGSWVVGLLAGHDADGALATAADWRAVAGVGVAYAVVAVLGLGVGVLVRQAAGAVTVVLGWLLVEVVVAATPAASRYLAPWLPFTVLNRFTSADLEGRTTGSIFAERAMFGPWAALAYTAGAAVAVLVAGLVVTRRRDA